MKKKILVVDDEPDILRTTSIMLEDEGYEVITATNGEDALRKACVDNPDLILLDIMMPGMDGLEAQSRLKNDALTAHIPVIFLTARSSGPDKIKGLRRGVDDYITKPFDPDELLARMELILERKNFYEGISMMDALTGAYNTHFFKKQFSLFFNTAKRYKRIFSLTVIDIDNFKQINDTYGHAAGDFILKKFYAIAKDMLRDSDIITRYGGDEFVIILPESTRAQASDTMQRIRSAIEGRRFIVEPSGAKISFSISAGVAQYSETIKTEAQLFNFADSDMYQEKKNKQKLP